MPTDETTAETAKDWSTHPWTTEGEPAYLLVSEEWPGKAARWTAVTIHRLHSDEPDSLIDVAGRKGKAGRVPPMFTVGRRMLRPAWLINKLRAEGKAEIV